MRVAVLVVVLLACKGDDKNKPELAKPDPMKPTEPVQPADPLKPVDDMDEKMRHCPLTLAGANVRISEAGEGVVFEIRGKDATVAEIQKRARHVVEFAGGRSQAGMHGGGSGGGRMRNCPVVTSGVVIHADDLPDGAKLTVTPMSGGSVDELRRETAARLDKFAFAGVTIQR